MDATGLDSAQIGSVTSPPAASSPTSSSSESGAQRRPRQHRRAERSRPARAAQVLLAALAITTVVTGAILFDTDATLWVRVGTWLVRELVPGTITFAVTALIVLRHPKARVVGWVMLAAAVAWGLSVLCAGLYIQPYVYAFSMLPLLGQLSGLFTWIGAYLILYVLPQVFPDGPLRGWLWRGLLITHATLATAAQAYVAWLFWPGGLHRPSIFDSILVKQQLQNLTWNTGVLLVITVFVVRLRRGTRLVRQQVTPFAVVWLLSMAADEFRFEEVGATENSWAYAVIFLWPVVVAIVIAVTATRVGLWDTRLVVRRIVVYAGVVTLLTLVFAAVYATVLLALSSATLDTGFRWLPSLAAAIAVIAADPLRRRIKDRLERRLLGDRSEPLRPLARLDALTSAEETGTEGLYQLIAATVAQAVRAPGASLALHQAPTMAVVASTGLESTNPVVLPLLHRAERLGELRVAPRTPGEPYGRRDRQLLDRLASQAAALVYELRRDADIDALRTQAVDALMAQRSAIGRDLHDGLAPLLAGAGLTADALRRGMPADSADAEEAALLSSRLRAAASQVRRISHDLQPETDSMSFSAVVLDHVASLRGPGTPHPTVTLADGVADRLPPVTEIALTRVAVEAITNVVRHAQAARADLSLSVHGREIVLRVVDDGRGLDLPYVAGSGITTMRSQVQALGGSFVIAGAPGKGTVLEARVPATTFAP